MSARVRLLLHLSWRPLQPANGLHARGAVPASRPTVPLRPAASAVHLRRQLAASPPPEEGGVASSRNAPPCPRLVRCLGMRAAGRSLARGGPLRPVPIPGGLGREVASPPTVPGPFWLPRGPKGGGLKLPSLALAPCGRRPPSLATPRHAHRSPIGTPDEAGDEPLACTLRVPSGARLFGEEAPWSGSAGVTRPESLRQSLVAAHHVAREHRGSPWL